MLLFQWSGCSHDSRDPRSDLPALLVPAFDCPDGTNGSTSRSRNAAVIECRVCGASNAKLSSILVPTVWNDELPKHGTTQECLGIFEA